MTHKLLNTRDICYISIFTSLTVIMAQVSIPMPLGVPMTMQTFAVTLAGVVLGAKNGFLSAAIYVLLGIVGVPVFAHFGGGLGSVLGPTGGFILSFPIMAWLVGYGTDSGRPLILALGLLMGIVVNFACGMLVFSLLTQNSWQAAFTACVLPFILPAAIKASLAGFIGDKIRKRFNL